MHCLSTHKQSCFYGLLVAQPTCICSDGPISRWRLQSMYQHFHGNIIAREQMFASKSTSSSLQSLPQSAVVIAMCSNYFKVANLKQSEVRIVHLLSFFFKQPSAITRLVLHSKKPPVTRKFSEDGPFELRFEHNCDLTPAIVLRGRLRGHSVLAVGRHSSMHTYTDDATTTIT